MSEEQLGNASDEQEQGTTEPMVAEAKLRELQSVKDQEIAQQQRAYQAQIRAQEQRLAAMEASLGSMAQNYMEPEDYLLQTAACFSKLISGTYYWRT